MRPLDGDAVSAFADGQIDLTGIGSFDASWIRYDRNLGPSLQAGAALSVQYFAFDTTRPPFDDERVRRAFTLALDLCRQLGISMITTSTGGHDASSEGGLEEQRQQFLARIGALCDEAAESGITICFETHGGLLATGAKAARRSSSVLPSSLRKLIRMKKRPVSASSNWALSVMLQSCPAR